MNTAQRMEIERTIVRHLIQEAAKVGYVLRGVDDGEGCIPVTAEKAAMDLVFGVDEASLKFQRGPQHRHAYCVLGNDGYDVIADYSMDRQGEDQTWNQLMDRLNEYADQFT